jgi:hypothetical protein
MTEITLPDEWIDPSLELDYDEIDLVGVDGNAGSIMAFTSDNLKRAGNSHDVVNAFRREAMSSNYEHLLCAAMTYLGT